MSFFNYLACMHAHIYIYIYIYIYQIVSKLAWILVDFYNDNKNTIAIKFDIENFNGNNDFNL